jgi:hypothetical protein
VLPLPTAHPPTANPCWASIRSCRCYTAGVDSGHAWLFFLSFSSLQLILLLIASRLNIDGVWRWCAARLLPPCVHIRSLQLAPRCHHWPSRRHTTTKPTLRRCLHHLVCRVATCSSQLRSLATMFATVRPKTKSWGEIALHEQSLEHEPTLLCCVTAMTAHHSFAVGQRWSLQPPSVSWHC